MHLSPSEFWNCRHSQNSWRSWCQIPALVFKWNVKKTCKNRNAGYEWPFLCQHVQEGFMGLLRAVVGRLTWPQLWNFEDKGQMGNRNMLKNQFHFFFLFLLSRSLTFKWDVQNETSIQKRKSFKNWSNTENILLS